MTTRARIGRFCSRGATTSWSIGHWEGAYLALVRKEWLEVSTLFLDQIVQVILRNVLDDCEDVFVLRAAELFFRPQKLAVYGGSLLAADVETFSAAPAPSPP